MRPALRRLSLPLALGLAAATLAGAENLLVNPEFASGLHALHIDAA